MNSFEKRQWIRIVLCVLAVAALALVVTGLLNGGEQMTYRTLTDEEKEAAKLAAAPGAFTAEKETNFSTIQVLLNTEDGKITGAKITSTAKSEGSDFLTDEIRDAWAKSIVENQSAENDVISGATLQFSAGAVKEAVAEIRQQMNGGEAGAEAQPAGETPAETDGKPEETETAEKPEESAKPETTPAAAEDSGSSQALYGTYLSEKETNFSVIRVLISTKNGEIVKCRIDSEAKSEGSDFLTDEIKTAWAKAVVENQGAETDAITGATLTFSSQAVRDAVAEIQGQIGGGAAVNPEAKPEENKTEEKTEETKPAAEAKDGGAQAVYATYLAEKETHFSTIRVIVSTKNGEIVKCRIESEEKFEGGDLLTSENKEAWAKAITASQGAEIDTVTGATVSSDAVREAVAEIRARMNGEEPPATAETTDATSGATAESEDAVSGATQTGEKQAEEPEEKAEDATSSATAEGGDAVSGATQTEEKPDQK